MQYVTRLSAWQILCPPLVDDLTVGLLVADLLSWQPLWRVVGGTAPEVAMPAADAAAHVWGALASSPEDSLRVAGPMQRWSGGVSVVRGDVFYAVGSPAGVLALLPETVEPGTVIEDWACLTEVA